MKKSLFVVALFALSAMVASAQVPFNTPTASATIAVHATIQQSASIVLSANSVNFNVIDPTVATDGDKSINVVSKVSMAKGHGASMEIGSTDLVAMGGAGNIPAKNLLAKTSQSAGYFPLDNDPAMNAILAINTNGGALLNATPSGLSTSLSFQLAPVPTFVPDQYSGTVTLILYVL
jgi:hypothetical protein